MTTWPERRILCVYVSLCVAEPKWPLSLNAPINVKPLGGRPGKGGGFDSNHRPVVGFFDRFNGLSSNILLTFSCYFDNPQCPGVGHLNGNSQLSSNAPPMPSLPPPAA